MAAKSAVDTALANVRERIAPLEAELAGLRIAEAALLDAGEPVAAAPKVKRGRGPNKKKPGLPAAEDESARMAV